MQVRANNMLSILKKSLVAVIETIVIVFILSTMPLAEELLSPTSVFDLNSCIDYAMKNSPALQVSDAYRLSKKYELDYQKTDSWPKIDFTGSVGYMGGERAPIVASVGAQPIVTAEIENWYYSTTIGFSVPIFYKGILNGMESPSVTQARAVLEMAEYSHEVNRATIIYDITAAYFSALKYKEEIKAEEERVKAMQAHYNTALAKYNLNIISLNDLLLAEVEHANAEKDLATAHNNLALSLANLANSIGYDSTKRLEIAPVHELPLVIPRVDEMINMAYKRRPEVMIQESEIKKVKAALSLIKSEKLPTVWFATSYSIIDDYSPPISRIWISALRLDMPLIDFGAANKKIAKAEADVVVSEKNLHQIKNDVSREVFQAYISFKNAEIQLPLMKKHVEQAQEALRLTEEKFAQNIVPQSSVLDAQAALTTAKKALLQAQFDQRMAYASIRKAVGE
jgi:outer membrane protein TolC